MKIILNNNDFEICITTSKNASTYQVREVVKLAMKLEGYTEQGINEIINDQELIIKEKQ